MPKLKGQIEDVLEDQVATTKDGGHQKFLVKSKNPPRDCSLILVEDSLYLDPGLCDTKPYTLQS